VKIKFYLAFFAAFSLSVLTLNTASFTLSSYLPALPSMQLYEDRWNWNTIDTTKISFPCNFIWGTGDSAFQTEGVVTAGGKTIKNSWTEWEEQIIIKDGIKQPRTPLNNRAGKACERWTYYKEDIQREKQLGMNAHRFSLEWSKIEPQKGVFDPEAMQHYIDYAKEMLALGIQPIPTLWHHTWPLWLKHGFETEESKEEFTKFALYVLHAFKDAGLLKHVKIWLTLNEPIGYVLAAYIDGKYPPGKKFSFDLAGKVAKNLLDTHISVYEAFKKVDPTLKISFAHMMNPIQPYHPWNPLDYLPAKIFDYLTNDVALEYFKTGNFYWLNIADWKDITLNNFWNKLKSLHFNIGIFSVQHNSNAIGKLDFIGVNYYTHTLLKMFKLSARPEEILADNYEVKAIKANYPEGFYHSLKKAATLGIPILITENGFAATDKLRDDYLKKHLYVIYKAMDEGVDIRGYLFWTLTDCFGWNSGQYSRHGILHVDFKTQERTFRPGAQYLVDVIKEKSYGNAIQPLG
jgi:beta-glucosidase